MVRSEVYLLDLSPPAKSMALYAVCGDLDLRLVSISHEID